MLVIDVPAIEVFDETTNEFLNFKPITLKMEHSLVSISKWEQKWLKPFLSKDKKTLEETIDYIRFMTITQNVDPRLFYYLPNEAITAIEEYIKSPSSATKINKQHFSNKGSKNADTPTAELIYTSMVLYNIPFEVQKWHINKLLTLIELISIKNSPPKKMSRRQILEQNKSLNDLRRKRLGTSG